MIIVSIGGYREKASQVTRKREWESEGREKKGKSFFLCSSSLAARSLIALFATRNGELARRLLEQLESLKLDYPITIEKQTS